MSVRWKPKPPKSAERRTEKIWKYHIVHVYFIFTIKISMLPRISIIWYKLTKKWKSLSSLDLNH